jgi:O-antigen ligase
MWQACIETMVQHPLGIGASNWGEIVENFGFRRGKLAHTLWLQIGAELGYVGLALLITFYGGCVVRLWPLTRPRTVVPDPLFRDLARMVIAALAGFAVAAQFVSLDLLEHPYYITLIGAGLLKLQSLPPAQPDALELTTESDADFATPDSVENQVAARACWEAYSQNSWTS